MAAYAPSAVPCPAYDASVFVHPSVHVDAIESVDGENSDLALSDESVLAPLWVPANPVAHAPNPAPKPSINRLASSAG